MRLEAVAAVLQMVQASQSAVLLPEMLNHGFVQHFHHTILWRHLHSNSERTPQQERTTGVVHATRHWLLEALYPAY
jgi:hypothetical protein